MTEDTITQATAEADTVAARISGLFERTLQQLGTDVGAKAVFGEPVTQGGRTVIPVARVILGTGAGGGQADSAEGSGFGAGAGAAAQPVGYIEITSDEATFVPLRKPWLEPALLLAAVPLVLILTRTVVKLIRG